MRNITSQKLRIMFLLGLLMTCFTAIAQTPVPPGFSARLTGGNIKVKGDVVFVGNNILNRSPNPNTPYNGNTDNNGQTMEYIDIDGDSSTRNSSSADLTLAACDRVVYAGLYWASTYPYERSTDNNAQWTPSDATRHSDFNQIKFKLPTGGYIDITGSILFDGRAPILNQSFKDAPAICYYDVTSLVQGLANPTGTYTVANMRSSKGQRSGSSSAGWVMVIIYENPTLPSKFISTYDGYAGVSSGNTDIAISGFVTLPSPNPVNARLGVGALEGDKGLTNDKLQFKANLTAGWTDIGNTLNPTDNFFNSTITKDDAQVPGRNPYGQNTLGLDLDMLAINNPSNNVIKNNETGATLRLTSSGDGFGAFLATFAVDIIEPNIKLVKKVRNSLGQDIAGQNVTLSAVLDYVITFDNIGNDDAKNFVLTDVLPVNTSFVSLSMPTVTAAGGTYSYNAATHTVTINVPQSLVKKDVLSSEHEITIRVKVASSCNELTDACSSTILNSAYATYQGVINTATISNNPSASGLTSCGAPITGPANFLVDVSACVYSRSEVLCNGSLVLTGGDGYGTYTWYKEDGAVDIPMGTGQSITVFDTGVYYYDATPIAPCIVPIHETITVTNFTGVTLTNPVIAVADVTSTCPNNGTKFPKIFLCGSNDSQYIPTGISSGIVRWQKLGAGCTTIVPADCPHQTCPSDWTTVFTGPNYTVTDAGEYRIAYDANGTGACLTYFYFYVSKNNFTPIISVKDKICTTNGEIKVENAPSNYQIRLINQATNAVIVDFPNTNPVFSNVAPGGYIVEIKQTGVANGCTFRVADITVLNKTITGTVFTSGKTCNLPGSVTIQAAGVNPQYSYTLTGPGVSLTHGPDTSSTHTFSGLNPGTYTVTVTTPDGCSFSSPAIVDDLSTLSLNAVVSQHISCNQGNIQMNASGGKTPYSYAIYSYNGALQNPTPANYQTSVIFDIPLGMQGTYVFIVTDANNCTALSSPVTINLVPDVVFTDTIQDVLCNGQSNGSITLNITSTNGYSVSFDLLNSSGTVIATNTSGVFTGLAPGDYTVVLHQTKGSRSCDFSFPYTITQPTAITAGAPSVTQQYTCTTTATIFIDPTGISGGTAPYTYSINGTTYGASSTFTGLTAGTYTVRVKDASGCVLSATPITIPALTPPTDLAFSATPVSCPTPTSTVTLTTTGGSGALNYQITAPSVVNNGTSNVFVGLAPGTYTFRVTDAKGCSYQENFTINAITPMSVVGAKVNDARCFGSATGALNYTVTGITPNYNYTVTSTGTAVPAATGVTSGTINLTNLAAGTYTITVTNPTTGCTATAAVTINNPTAALAVTKTVTQPDCTVTTGSLSVTATNGWGGYSYALSGQAAIGPQASPNFTGLAAGNYTLTVTDANGCIFTDPTPFTIDPVVQPVLSITSSDLCLAGGTSITVAVNAGTGAAPFQYQLDSGSFQSSPTFTGLAAGTHTVTVRDAKGCTATTASQTVNTLLTAAAVFTKGLDCSASPDAQITVNIAGGSGTGTYTYEVKVGAAAFAAGGSVTGSSFTHPAATANTYQFRITDAAGCIVTTNTITVTPITSPQFTLTPTPVLCFGAATGAIAVNINTSFGTAPYTIGVTNTDTSFNYGAQTAGLPAGNYTVRVTDSKGCHTDVTTVIGTTNPITYNITPIDLQCTGSGIQQGEIRIGDISTPLVPAVTGGTAPYTYNVSNNFGQVLPPHTSATGLPYSFTIVNYGIYTVNVVDANGCSVAKNNIVIASPPNSLTITATSTSDCVTGGTVKVKVGAVVVGTGYKFAILTQNTIPYVANAATDYILPDVVGGDEATFNGLIPGVVYTFVVWDTNTNCYYFKQASAAIPTNSTIGVTSLAPHTVTCTETPALDNGSVSITFNGYDSGTTQIEYKIYKSPSNIYTGQTGTVPTTGTSTTINNIGALAPGDYIVLLTEVDGAVAGCGQATASFTISQSATTLVANAAVTKNDNCNINAGIITASAQYGTGPYAYQIELETATAPTVATWAGQASPVFNVEGGDYTVYVKDAYNCIKEYDIHIDTDVSPDLTAVLAPGTQCTTAEGDFVINVTRINNGSIGPFQYSLDGGPFQQQALDSFSFTGLNSGTHTVQIKDVNGCTMATAFSVPVYAPIDVTAQPTVQPTCLNGNLGTIEAVGTGGSAPANLRYELQTTAGVSVAGPQASPVFAGQPAGSYKVVISDTATICTAEVAVTLDATVPVTFSTTKDDVNCLGGTDGSITITLPNTNTDIPYTYTIDGALSAAVTQTQPVFTGLAADTYTVTVTSGKGCTATQTVTITTPTAVVAGASVTTPFACAPDNTVNTATVTVTGTGGTPTYTYSIDGTNYTTTNTFAVASTGASQNITAYVKDSNGCIDDVPLTINPLPVITSATAVLTTAIECDDNQGVITVTAAGGSGDFTFTMLPSGPSFNTALNDFDQTFTITEPGVYTFEIKDDVTGCTTIVSAAEIFEYDVIDAVATASTPVVCYGSSTGSVTVDVQNYSGAYNYSVFDGATSVATGTGNTTTNPFTITGLPSGNLFVRIAATGSPFCSADTNIILVDSPADPLALNAVMTYNATCTNNQGEITAQATGGWGNYQYQLVNAATSAILVPYSTTNVFTVLASGNYTVSVRDSGNCIVNQNVNIPAATPITATIAAVTPTALLCYGDTTASVTATASGGQGLANYEYILNTYDAAGTTIVISTGAQPSPVFTGLGAGIYSITVVDGWSCGPVETAQVTITQPAPLVGYLSLTKTLTCTTQAEVTISASGGTPPYQYSTDDVTYSSTPTVFQVGAGTHTYYVKDNNGCAAVMTNSVEIAPIAPIVIALDLDAAQISCAGSNNAVINAVATGGLGGYQYTLTNNDNAATITNTTGLFTGLAEGHYQVSVISGDCNATSPTIVEILQPIQFDPQEVVTNVQCFGVPTGSITITTTPTTKGTAPIQYAISPNLTQFVNTPSFTGLGAGNYTVVAQDARGCFEVFNITITQPMQIEAEITIHSDETCLGEGDGTIDIHVEGGSPPYVYSLNNYATITTIPGTYNAVTGVTHQITGLLPGTTTVWVRDANGCSINPAMTQEIKAGVNLAPQAAVTETCVANAPNNDVTISITLTGNPAGSPANVTYSIDGVTWVPAASPTATSYTFTNVSLPAGTYTAYAKHTMPGPAPVTDRECVQTVPFTIVQHNAIAATAAVTTPIACNAGTGTITINVTSSTGTLQYAVGPAFAFGSSNVFSGLTAGTYDFKVRDVLGCELDITDVVLSQPTALTATVSGLTHEICLGDNGGAFTITPAGGTPDYQVSINGGTTYTALSSSPVTFNGLAANTYNVVVRDANGCTYTITPAVTVNPGADLQPSVAVDPYCQNNVIRNTVLISDAVFANVGQLTYSFDGGPYTTVDYAQDLAPGLHTYGVQHTNGCIFTDTFTVPTLSPIMASVSATTNVNCFGAATGAITVTATGGTGTLSYAIADADVLPLAFGTYQASNTFTGLTAGNYVVSILDDNLGCETQVTATLTEPALALSATAASTNEICINAANGTITVTATGGTAPYQARLNGGAYSAAFASTFTFNGLTPTAYTIEVLDANGCTFTIPGTVTIAPGVDLQAAVSADQVCNTTTITLSANPAIAPANLTYTLDGGAPQAYTTAGIPLTGLTAGTHNVIITHSNGCSSAPLTFNVAPIIPIVISATAKTDVSCFGGVNGTATVTATGGTAPLTYAIAPNVLPLVYGPYQSAATFTGLAAGDYVINVKDALGCEMASTVINVAQPIAGLSATAASTNEICINAANGTITVTATGGTAPYQARLNGGAYSAAFASTFTFNGLTPTAYTIEVLDANGCTFTIPGTVTIAPGVDLQAALNAVQVCNTTTITLSANPAIAPANLTYTLDGGAPQAYTTAGIPLTGLTAGTHTVIITHSNGCSSAPLTFNVAPIIPIVISATAKTDVSCFGGVNGTATVTATGGTAPLTYAIAPNVLPLVYGPYQSAATFTGLAAGDYVINVKDALGCEMASTVINVAQPIAGLSATAASTNEICINAANGTITVTATGGTAPYQARLNGGAYSAAFASTFTFNGLTPTAYTIEVLDANGCTFTIPGTVTITPGVDLQAAVNAVQVCNTTTITLSANPAIAPANLTYTLDGGAPQAYTTAGIPLTGLTAGTHNVIITHSNGCSSAPLTFNVAPIIPIVISATAKTDVSCFGGVNGTATVTATGGTAPLTYAIAPNVLPLVYGPYQSAATFTGLAAGDYVINVKDALGCEMASTVINVAQPIAGLSATAASTNEICINAADGTITVTATGGTAPYQARLNGGAYSAAFASTFTFNGLTPTAYTIEVLDANGCTFTIPGTVTIAPGFDLQAAVSADQVCDTTTITLSANPAIAPANLTYTLDGGAPQAYTTAGIPLTGLTAGTHTVIITHSNGCSSAPLTFNVAPIIPIVVNPSTIMVTNIACHGKDVGSIVVNATGGTGPLQYAITWDIWPTAFYGPSNTFNDLLAGDYTVHVKDAMGCIQSVTVTITEPADELILAAAVGQHESCAGAHDGSIDVTLVQGGTPPYSIALDSPQNFQPYNPAAGADFAGLYGRTLPYEIYVRDANGCYAKAIVTIQKGVSLVPGLQTVLSCVNNAPVNTVTATLNAVVDNVEYKLETATGTLIQDFSTVKTWTLAPGNYVYTVRHINGCVKTYPFTVQPRVPITVTSVIPTDAACNGGTDGTLTVTATGGTGNLQYGISPDYVMTSNPVFTGLPAGTYTVRVQDQYGCYVDFSNFPPVGEPAVLAMTETMNLPEVCVDDNNGAFEIDITGGTAPYATSLDANGPFVTDQTLFENLDAGTYTVYVQDAKGCTMTQDVTLIAPLDIDAKAEVVYNCDQNTVTITTNGAINPGELNYSIVGPKDGNNPPQVSNVFENLEDGTYTVEVINTVTGCTDVTEPFQIISVPDLAISLSMSGLNQFTATVMGGQGPYYYTLDGDSNGSKNVFTYFRSGIYVVTVTDARGCTREARIEVKFVDIILPDVVTPDDDGQNDTWSPGNTANYPKINSFVFDRYGRKLATLRQGDTWDGTYDGHPMPTGDYWYLIELNDAEGRSFVGHFTIYR